MGCRIALYEYDVEKLLAPGQAGDHGLLSQATLLLDELTVGRQRSNASTRPIVFICHGFGGILVKRALALSLQASYSNHAVGSIFSSTHSVLFGGTPHHGIQQDALKVLYPDSSGPPSQFILDLVHGSDVLDDINDHYAPLVGRVRAINFWEQRKTYCGSLGAFIVPETSAAPLAFTSERYGVPVDHAGLLSFSAVNDPGLDIILETLSSCVDSCVQDSRPEGFGNDSLVRGDQGNGVRQSHGHDFRQNIISGGRAHFGNVYHYYNDSASQQPRDLSSTSGLRKQNTATPPRDGSSMNEWYKVERTSSAQFTGRQSQSKILEEGFGTPRLGSDQIQHNIAVVYGLGGSGKTQFCLRYAERHRSEYWGVFWIDASTRSNAESGYASIGLDAGKGATFSAGKYWLSRRKTPWLLVLDNADDPELEIADFFPTGNAGHILISTRNPNVIVHANVGSFRFRGMDPEEGVELLLKSAYPKGQPEGQDPQQRTLANNIAAELGYLAIALDQAGHTIRRKIYTLERYLYSYLGYRHRLLNSPAPVRSLEANVITTWEIPFRQIEDRVGQEYTDAVALVHVFAFLHFEAISEQIFSAAWVSMDKASADHPDLLRLDSRRLEEAQARLRCATGILCDYSIIDCDDERKTCALHPVVHRWAKTRLEIRKDSEYWLRCAIELLTRSISPYFEASGQSYRRSLLRHIDSCRAVMQSHDPTYPKTSHAIDQVERFAMVYAENGQWKTALALHIQVFERRRRLFGKSDRTTLRAQRNVSRVYWNLFEVRPVIELQRQILSTNWVWRQSLRDWLRPLKPEHVAYCIALDDLTESLWLAGERDWSKWTGERAVAGFLRRLGPDDPLTLNAMFNLGRTCHHLGEYARSHSLLTLVLRKRKRFFGINHVDTLMVKNELGMSLCARKIRMAVAERLVASVLEARKRQLGEEHAYTLWSVNDLSRVLNERGQSQKAAEMLEEILPVVARTLGDKHAGSLMTKANLARAYNGCQRWKDSEPLVAEALKLVDENHTDWMEGMLGFAKIEMELGKFVEAEHAANEVLQKLTRTPKKGTYYQHMKGRLDALLVDIRSRREESHGQPEG